MTVWIGSLVNHDLILPLRPHSVSNVCPIPLYISCVKSIMWFVEPSNTLICPFVSPAIPPDRLSLVCHSDAAFANVGVYTQAGFVIGFTDAALDEGVQSKWTPAIWKSYRLPRAVASTLSAEAQAMANATGTAEWTALLLLEAMHGSFEVRDFVSKLSQIKSIVVTDCKSLYYHLVSVSAPIAVEDCRRSIGIVIIRQSPTRLKSSIRWVPTNRMIADSLAKDSGDPTDLLRACIRQGSYQITPEETVLEM